MFQKKKTVATWIAKISLATIALYAVLLLAFSLASKETALAAGEEKYFCEIDCHLAYSVVDSHWTKEDTYAVTLRTRFDQTTTSPTRPKEIPLQPNPHAIHLFDADGNYPLSCSCPCRASISAFHCVRVRPCRIVIPKRSEKSALRQARRRLTRC